MKSLKELERSLTDVGLSDKERHVYLCLFEMGGRGFPSAIAEKAGLNRSTTYKVLTSLSIKGLVSDIEKSKKIYYQLNKPEKLVSYIEYQSKEVGKKLQDIRSIVPELSRMFSHLSEMPKVQFFEGYNQVQDIYVDMTRYKNYEMLAFFNVKYVETFWDNERLIKWVKERERQKVSMRAILPDTPQNRSYARRVYGIASPKYRPIIRHVPEEIFPYDCEVTAYGTNRVAIFKLNKETLDKQMVGIIIEDEMIHKMIRMIFELAWEGTKKYSKEK